MSEFLVTTLRDKITPASDGSETIELPSNPLSHLILSTKVLTNGADVDVSVGTMLDAISDIDVEWRGQSIFQASGRDAHYFGNIVNRKPVAGVAWDNEDDGVHILNTVIPFGRRLFDPASAFKAPRPGESSVRLTFDISGTNYDGLVYSLAAVELPEASPERYLRTQTLAQTPSATGVNDIALPLGNPLWGIMIFGTTVPDSTTDTHTIQDATFLLDNFQRYYNATQWQVLRSIYMQKTSLDGYAYIHTHRENIAGAYSQNAETEQSLSLIPNERHYGYMDFAPLDNDEYIPDLAGLGSATFRYTADIAEAVRVLPAMLVSNPT